ncbi:trans-sialidase [Trypanosoma cruzi]|nr:trans-sialidase [Trypanosoma cruzi]
MQAKNKDGTSVLLSMRLPKSENKWELSSETPGKCCRDPTLVKWKEDKDDERLFMMAHCAGGYYDVYSPLRMESIGIRWVSQLTACGATHTIERGTASRVDSLPQSLRKRGDAHHRAGVSEGRQ